MGQMSHLFVELLVLGRTQSILRVATYNQVSKRGVLVLGMGLVVTLTGTWQRLQ